jgi:hypothetical protein
MGRVMNHPVMDLRRKRRSFGNLICRSMIAVSLCIYDGMGFGLIVWRYEGVLHVSEKNMK